MPALLSCPRCTQALPASARFCRRCGAAMVLLGRARIATPAVRGKHGPVVSSALAVMLLAALILGGFVVHHVGVASSIAPVAPIYSYPAPIQPAYPQVTVPRYNNYPPVVVVPDYPNREHREHLHRDYNR